MEKQEKPKGQEPIANPQASKKPGQKISGDLSEEELKKVSGGTARGIVIQGG